MAADREVTGHSGIWGTIRFRFALWTAGLLLAVLAGFSTFVYLSLAQGLRASIDDTLQLSATQAASAIEVEDGRLDLPDSFVEAPEHADLSTSDLTLRLFSPDGRVMATYGSGGSLPVSAEALEAARDGRSTFATVSQPGQPGIRLYTTPVENNDTLVGVIQVSQSMSRVQETLRRLLIAFLIGVPFLMIIAGLGGYGLAARALTPIDDMTRTANRVSGEDLSTRLNLPPTNDEVGRLAATFDGMLSRLEGAFQRERQFTADASHELRTPLAAMQAILDVTRERPRTPAEYQKVLGDLAEETNRLSDLTRDLLLLARGNDQTTSTFEEIDLSMLLPDIVDSMRPLAETKGLRLASDISDGLVVLGNMDDLIRLFVNLADNAIKYTGAGRVEIIARRVSGRVEVRVTDTGIGISAEHLPHLFERFYRVEKSRTSDGAGLGLAIAQEIVKAHAGSIEVASVPGEGTVFTVRLRNAR